MGSDVAAPAPDDDGATGDDPPDDRTVGSEEPTGADPIHGSGRAVGQDAATGEAPPADEPSAETAGANPPGEAGGRATVNRGRRLDRPLIASALVPWSWFVVRDLNPWTDIVAAGLLLSLVSYVVVMAVLWFPRHLARFTAASLSTVAVAMVAIVGPWLPQSQADPTDPLRIVTANVESASGARAAATVDAILSADADLVVVTEQSNAVASLLKAAYPHEVSTDILLGAVAYGRYVGVYGRVPLRVDASREDYDTGGGLRVVVEHNDPFVVYAAHLPPLRMRSSQEGATPATQRRIVDGLVKRARGEDLPVVLIGDLNAPDRGRSFRSLDGSFRDASRASWAGPTSRRPAWGWLGLLLRIDHVLIPQDWCARDAAQIRLPFSDHVAVATTIGRCPTS